MSLSSSSAYSSRGCPPKDCEPLPAVTRCPPKPCKPKPRCAPRRKACKPKPKCVKREPKRKVCLPKREACVPRRACVTDDGDVSPRREPATPSQDSEQSAQGSEQESMAIDIADMGASVEATLDCNSCSKKKRRKCKPCGE